ncbi:MAG: cyclic nucleotide-binding domain-containing protein [Verrucomicrobia bacterium]|nr:cyclic nucleotide-binding domain-containing protein [Verrucomicrobiota bacterium]MCH8526709.1 cyclic nucleotide-binding domain-containing protein [Kiritimatiellia bacterium]
MSDPLPTLSTADALALLVERARALGREPEHVTAGDSILNEGDTNTSLFILLEGTAQLLKRTADGRHTPVDLLGPGSLLGILSFWTGRPAFSDSVAASDLKVLRLDLRDFERGVAEDAEFARVTQQLLVANLSDRYRRVVGLNLKVAGLTKELETERNALREAVEDLQRTRNKLIHQEKLATMGQLLAGIAHEINNPSSALMKNVEQLTRELPVLFAGMPAHAGMLREGMNAPYLSSGEARDRLQLLQERYPNLSRSLCRRLSRLPEAAMEPLSAALSAKNEAELEMLLRIFEVGTALQSIRIAEARMTRLVKSLKSYSRQEERDVQSVRLDDCIRDTLTVMNHRLKLYDLQLEPADLPEVSCRPGEINQILTNLLSNACEATPEGRVITVRTGMEPDAVWVEIEDQGHGIPEDLIEAIFRPNVTTKRGAGDFGLGLGLAISRDLALKHHGRLTAKNRKEGGAVFRLTLPTV